MNIIKSVSVKLALFATIVSFFSCSNDFDLTEGKVDIPVVYGVISDKDTATYIRVERAFSDEETSAFILAKDPALLYYDNIEVSIVHVKTGKSHPLKRVDGTLEGYQRAPGTFADAPNYLYKIKNNEINYVGKDDYRLVIKKNDNTILTEATTTAITPYSVSSVSTPNASAKLAFGYNTDFRIRWSGGAEGVIHDIKLLFHITEVRNNQSVDTTITWNVARNLSRYEHSFKGQTFYEFMNGAFIKETNVERFFNSAELVIITGGQAVKDYISIGQANLGITSSGEIPIYTNLSNGGVGLFSAKTEFIRTDIELAPATLDSLRNGIFTKSLNFK